VLASAIPRKLDENHQQEESKYEAEGFSDTIKETEHEETKEDQNPQKQSTNGSAIMLNNTWTVEEAGSPEKQQQINFSQQEEVKGETDTEIQILNEDKFAKSNLRSQKKGRML